MVVKSSSNPVKLLRKLKQDSFAATITISRHAHLVRDVIAQENIAWERSSFSLACANNTLKVRVRASDATALKATMISLLKRIELASKLAEEHGTG